MASIAGHPEFKQVSAQEYGETLRLAPHTHGTDGFFAAVLERAG